MRNAWWVGWVGLLFVSAGALAAPVVDVGSHPLLDNTPGQTIQIWIMGDGNLAGLNLFAQVGDGGPELAGYGVPAGTDGPSIARVNLQPAGGIFTGKGGESNFAGIPQVASSTFDVTYGTVKASGLLVEVTIDTTGFSSGTWPLMLKGVLPFSALGGPYDTVGVAPGGQPLPIGITNGSISVPAVTNWIAGSDGWCDGNCWLAGNPTRAGGRMSPTAAPPRSARRGDRARF